MNDELLSFRAILVSGADEDHDLFRHAAAGAAVPFEIARADGASAVAGCLTGGADLVYIDEGVGPVETARTIAACRTLAKPPFTILLTPQEHSSVPFDTDALAAKPKQLDDATRLLDCSVRTRFPIPALIVDDSATMRSIVRKLLAGTRFPIEVSEADEGLAALRQVRDRGINFVFLDYNLPGFSGLEILSELRREKRPVEVVLMTSADDVSLAQRAREHGAGFLRKPFYPADVEAVLCQLYGLRALNPKRASA